MGAKDKRVDEYIAKAAEFAQPILKELRARIHAACPGVEETIKWGMPAFEYLGPFAGMGAFKQHAVFGFWKHRLVVGDDPKAKEAMGSYGCLKSVKDLPPKSDFEKQVEFAMELNEKGVKVERAKKRETTAARMHPDLVKALARHKKVAANFGRFPPSQQREYVEWIAEAKRDETRAKRLAQLVEWVAAGKPRNWKYMKR